MTDIKQIVFLTRPIAPPWDEASKNLAYYLALHVQIPSIQCILLTTQTKLALPSNIIQESIHTTKALNLKSKFRLLWYLIRSDIDCVHALFVFTPITGMIIKMLKLWKRFKVIQTVASISRNTYFLHFTVFGDEVVCFSKTTAALLKSLGVQPHVIPPAVSLERFKPSKKNKSIAFLGELHRQNSYAIVEPLIDLLHKKLPDYQILLGFRTTRKPRKEGELVMKLKRKLTGVKNIVFMDIIEDMPTVLAKTTLVILPARSVTEKFDYPLVLLEALACGTPIVISNIGPLGELSSYPGVLTPKSNTPQAFLDTIIRSLTSYPKLSKSARTTAEVNFNIEAISKKYEALYKKVLI